MEHPQDRATHKCDGHCHCEHVEIPEVSSANNHMVVIDWVITKIEKLKDDSCTTIDDEYRVLENCGGNL